MRSGARIAVSAALGAASGLLLVAAWRGFAASPERAGASWILYLCALFALVLAALPWRGESAIERAISRREWLGLALVVALGAGFRFHQLATLPYGVWFDEAQNGLEAGRILDDPSYRPTFVAGLSQMPAATFYYLAPFVRLLGAEIFALRLATTLVGLAALLAVWWLGRELCGPWEGLLAAAFLALSRWHVTFSRFAVAQIFVTLVPALVLALFLRSQRRASPRAAIGCGLVLGVGLQFYYAVAVMPFVLTLTFLFGVARRSFTLRRGALLLALTLVASAVAYAPILAFAVDHRAEFGKRFADTAIVEAASLPDLLSVFVEPSPRRAAAWSALGRNTLRHLRMFHFEGDANGRHNLPGAPMLDPVSGLFFLLGLVWCLARPLELRRAVLLLWLASMLAAGILSVEFEAPQGARTVGATTVVALLAGIALARLRELLDRRPGHHAGRIAAALLLPVAAASSWTTFFERQAWDASAWASWSTPETRIAEVVDAEGADRELYVPPEWLGGPTEEFLLGRPLEGRPFESRRDLPLEPLGRDALVFFAADGRETAERFRRFYPEADLQPFGPPRRDGSRGEPILWSAVVPAAQIAALSGWRIDYSGATEESRRSSDTGWSWDEAPLRPPFCARVRGTLRLATHGSYRLVLATDATATLWVDSEKVLESVGRNAVDLPLARGDHDLALEVDVRRSGATTALRWVEPRSLEERPLPPARIYSPELPRGGLLGSYFPNAGWAGEPALLQIDPQVAFYFHTLPLPRPFTVRWSGSIEAPVAGTYRFHTRSVDDSWLEVAGRAVVENRKPGGEVSASVPLEKGWHPIEVRYRAAGNFSQIYLDWTPPSGTRAPIPQAALRPPGPRGGTVVPAEPPVAAPDSSGTSSRTSSRTSSNTVPPREIEVERLRELGELGGSRLTGASSGPLLLLDPGRRRIRSFSVSNLAPGPEMTLPPAVRDPADLEVDAAGRIHLLDASGTIFVFAPGPPFGVVVERTIDLRPLAVYNPRGLAVSPDGELLIADTGGGRVLVCDPAGRLLRTVGTLGAGRGELLDPMDVAQDATGNLVVADVGNGRLVRFAPDGRVLDLWPRDDGRAALELVRLDRDSRGVVWAAGGARGELLRFDPAAGLTVFGAAIERPIVGLSARAGGRIHLVTREPASLVELRIP